LISIAWSQDGERVAVADRLGRIKILGVDGSERVLSETIDQSVDLRWSPDDGHLLVLQEGRAWIVNTTDR